MIKNLLIALLYSLIHSQEYLGVFRGCANSSLLPNTEAALTNSINFTVGCTAFKECAVIYNTTKQECLEDFSSAQELFCSAFTDNRRMKRYCQKIVFENMKIARKLEDSKFNGNFNAFKGMINTFDSTLCYFSNSLSLFSTVCDSTDNRIILSFVQLNNGKFVIKQSEDSCFLTSDLIFSVCNYNNGNFWFTIDLVDDGKNQVNLLNESSNIVYETVVISFVRAI